MLKFHTRFLKRYTNMENIISLDDLFHNRIFLIPDYQRGYSWEQRHIGEFLEDLEFLKSESYHYTGTVVLQPLKSPKANDAQGKQYTSVAIVDGQQRLTTIVILLNEIRKILDEIPDQSDELSNGIDNTYIRVKKTNGEDLFKLSLNSDNDHFFKNCIIGDSDSIEGPVISSHKRLESAANQIRTYLLSKINNLNVDTVVWLTKLYMKVANQLKFTIYEIEHEVEVGIIFEVMNDRGKPLTDLEKVKNYLLHVSALIEDASTPTFLTNAVNEAWTTILSQLMYGGLESSADEDRLLRASWLASYDPQSRNWYGGRSVKDRFRYRDYQGNESTLLSQLHTYTQQLREDCVSFCDAYKPSNPSSFPSFASNQSLHTEIVEWSDKLVRIGVVASFLPLFLAVRKRWPNKPSYYLKLIKLCEVFSFRVYLVNEYRADAGQAALYRFAYEVRNKRVSFDNLLSKIRGELEYRCTEKQFRDDLRARDYNWYHWSGLKYLLYEYELALASNKRASTKIKWEQINKNDLKDTIEHILPQNISRIAYWNERFNEEEHEFYLNNLGNLTLTKYNSNLGNKAFPQKKGRLGSAEPCYANSPFFMEQALVQRRHWTIRSIEDRRRKIVNWAIDRWKIDS